MEAESLSAEKFHMSDFHIGDVAPDSIGQQASEISFEAKHVMLDGHSPVESSACSEQHGVLQIHTDSGQKKHDPRMNSQMSNEPCPTDLLIDFSDENPWIKSGDTKPPSKADLHPSTDVPGQGSESGAQEGVEVFRNVKESLEASIQSSEFDMLSEEYIDQLIGKLDNPQPDSWLRRTSSSVLDTDTSTSPVLDTNIPSFTEMVSTGTSQVQGSDCSLQKSNAGATPGCSSPDTQLPHVVRKYVPSLLDTDPPNTQLPSVIQKHVPSLLDTDVPDLIFTHSSNAVAPKASGTSIRSHNSPNVTCAMEDECCPTEFLVSVMEPHMTYSTTKGFSHQGMHTDAWPDISKENEKLPLPLILNETGLIGLQSRVSDKGKMEGPKQTEMNDDREQTRAVTCRRPHGSVVNNGIILNNGSIPNSGSTLNNGSIPNSGSTLNNGSTPNNGSTLNSGSTLNNGSIPNSGSTLNNGSTPNNGSTLNSGSTPNSGSTLNNGSTPNNGSTLNNGELRSGHDNIPREYGRWRSGHDGNIPSEDSDWSSDDDNNSQSEHDQLSSGDDRDSTLPPQERMTEHMHVKSPDVSSEDQLNYFYSFDDKMMEKMVMTTTKSVLSVRSLSTSSSEDNNVIDRYDTTDKEVDMSEEDDDLNDAHAFPCGKCEEGRDQSENENCSGLDEAQAEEIKDRRQSGEKDCAVPQTPDREQEAGKQKSERQNCGQSQLQEKEFSNCAGVDFLVRHSAADKSTLTECRHCFEDPKKSFSAHYSSTAGESHSAISSAGESDHPHTSGQPGGSLKQDAGSFQLDRGMTDADNRRDSETEDKYNSDLEYRLQNSTGLTKNYLESGLRRSTIIQAPAPRLKVGPVDISCLQGTVVDESKRTGQSLKDQRPQKQYEEDKNDSSILHRQGFADDMQGHNQLSGVGKDNAGSMKVRQSAQSKLWQHANQVSSIISPMQVLPVKTQPLRSSPDNSHTVPSMHIVDFGTNSKTGLLCNICTERHTAGTFEKREDVSSSPASEERKETRRPDGRVDEDEQDWSCGELNDELNGRVDEDDTRRMRHLNMEKTGEMNKRQTDSRKRVDTKKAEEVRTGGDTDQKERDKDEDQNKVRGDQNSDGEQENKEEENKEELEDNTSERTVSVTGLAADDFELCELYFENTKRSNGGRIEENGCVWDDLKKQFLVTFVDRHAAERVLERSHAITGKSVQVKQWIPPPYFKDSVLVTGIPEGTSEDCLQNFLESVADVAIEGVQFSEADGKAMVLLEDRSVDLKFIKHLHQACQENPLLGGVLSVHCVPLSDTVRVQNLNPQTTDSTIRYFFSNKNRNSGGPVSGVTRLNNTSALVYFENHRDAQTVTDKGSHVLDNFPLKVSLHLECFSPVDRCIPGGAEEGHGGAGDCCEVSAETQTSDVDKDCQDHWDHSDEGEQHSTHEESLGDDLDTRPHKFSQQRPGRRDGFDHEAPPLAGHGRGRTEGSHDSASHRMDQRAEQKFLHHGEPQISKLHNNEHHYHEGHAPSAGSSYPYFPQDLTSAVRHNPQRFDRRSNAGHVQSSEAESHQKKYQRVLKNLGSEVVERFQRDQDELRRLATEIGQINGKFRWELPDRIVVTATKSDIADDWYEQVTKKIDKFRHIIEVKLGKGMNPLPEKKELSRPQQYGECGKAYSDVLRRQNNEQYSAINPSCTHPAEASAPRLQNTVQKVDKTFSNKQQPMVYEEVLNMKPCQVKVMKMPQVLTKFKEKCRSLSFEVDEEKRTLKLRVDTSPSEAKRMKVEVLTFVAEISETKIPLTPSLAKMLTNTQAQGFLQAELDRKEMACYLHLEFNSLSVSMHASHFERVENILKHLFREDKVQLDEDKLAVTKSSAWQELVDKLQHQSKEGLPPPVVMLDVQKKVVTITDVAENISKTLATVKTFFSTKKIEEKTQKIDENRFKFMQQFCTDDMKQLQEQSKENGVSVNIRKDGIVAYKGLSDSISLVYKDIKKFLQTIQCQQKSFSGPGVATYLSSSRGQEFLQQTGHANGCLVTISTGKVNETGESAENILARGKLEGGGELLIIQGDITKCEVDAIVNAANRELHHAGGVALAIAKAGGETIDEESRNLVERYDKLSDGEVVTTGGGRLPCSWVLHAVGPVWHGGSKGEAECLEKTIINVLKMANTKKCSSIAVPAISCGLFGFPVDRATDIIVHSVVEFFADAEIVGSLNKVILIDVGNEALCGLLDAAKNHLGGHLTMTGQLRESNGVTSHSSRSQDKSQSTTPEPGRDAGKAKLGDSSKDKKSRLPFRIIPGELTKSQADVIVSTVHPSLDMQKGVLSRSMLEHGGRKIQQDLQDFLKKRGPLQIGKVVRSSGGDLRCKNVLHLSLPMWRDDKGQVLKSAIRECLEMAKKMKQKSIAFPTLGTGKLGYPSDAVASIMQGVIGKWLHENRDSGLRDVQIVVFSKDRDSLEAFQNLERSHSQGEGARGRGGESRDMDTPSDLRVTVGDVRIIIKEGNILKESCDAIANSSNSSLDLTRGALSRKIREACGDEIVAECRKKKDEMEQEGVAATPVSASSLGCSYVIHVSADRFKQDWRQGVLKVLRLADSMDLRTVALPALGTGGLSGDPQSLARNMHEAIQVFSNQAKSVKEIRLVVFQSEMLLHYVNAFKRHTGSGLAQGEDRMARGGGGPHSSQTSLVPSKSVQVLVYSNKIGAADRVLERIDSHIKNNQITRKEEDKAVCKFSSQQCSQVKDLQRKHEVVIDLNTDHGTVAITGLETNVLEALAAVKDIKSKGSPHHSISTSMMAILWQYQVDKDKFRTFEPEHIVEIEAAYKKKVSSVELVDNMGRKYKIVFKEMKEYSLDNHNLSPITVRRKNIVQEKSQEIPLPRHWEPMTKGQYVKLVDLNPTSSEYQRVLTHFGGQPVKKIQRVQNPTLFQQYKAKKKELEMHNPRGTENETRLWHGTDSKNIDSIITNGFNRSYCGQHGTAYGQGVYFATNSGTSRGFSSGGQMFQARVLVGESTPGNSSMRIPPNKSGKNRPYDSLSGPGMFIIFHDSQAYPEYLLTL